MKKALLLIVAVVVATAAGLWGFSTIKSNRAANVPWPASLGPLDDAPKRFPDAEQSAGATKLVQLAAAAHIDLAPRARSSAGQLTRRLDPKTTAVRTAVGDYIKAQFERSGDAIDAPPPLAAQFLADNDAALNAVRDHLLSGAPIVWETKIRQGFDQPIPNLLGEMHLQKAFAARALDKARRNDPAAWDELRASWELNRGLWRRPDLISQLIALAASRMSNAAARKMPLPAPAWLRETYTFDYLGAMAASQQAEAWTIHRARRFPFQDVEAINVLRRYTDEALRSRACDAGSPQFATARASLVTQHIAVPNLVSVWHRLMRFRAELEATERVLELRSGQRLSVDSRCSDGTWQLTPNGMKFSRNVKVPPPGTKYPLEYTR